MKVDKNSSFKRAEDAIEYLYKNEHVNLYAYDEKTLHKEVAKLYNMIKDKNALIEDINDQIMATNPYYYCAIDGCLGVKCCDINIGLYKKCRGTISLFAGWNNSVLHGNYDLTPSLKALSSLALLGRMMR